MSVPSEIRQVTVFNLDYFSGVWNLAVMLYFRLAKGFLFSLNVCDMFSNFTLKSFHCRSLWALWSSKPFGSLWRGCCLIEAFMVLPHDQNSSSCWKLGFCDIKEVVTSSRLPWPRPRKDTDRPHWGLDQNKYHLYGLSENENDVITGLKLEKQLDFEIIFWPKFIVQKS